MDTNKKSTKMDMKLKFSILWIFLMFNYLYCDLLTGMESEVLKGYLKGKVDSIQINQGFLLGAAILMEIPTAMVLLSWVLKYRVNRWANIIAGSIMAVVQLSTLFMGTPTLHYLFYSTIEIACTLFIAWNAWKWKPDFEPNTGG